MKNLFSKSGFSLAVIICGMAFSSCYKSFDEKSYQPAFTVNGYTSSAEIGAGSLVGYWSFDGSYVDSVSNVAATSVNTSLAPGFKGKAMQGSATGYVIADLPAAIKNMNSFTVDYWLKTDNTSGIITPFSISNTNDFWGALDMFYENGGRTGSTANLKIHIKGQSEVWFTNGFITNPWTGFQNIGLTYDAATSKFVLYQNGNPVATQEVAGLGNIVFPSGATKIIFGTEQFQTTPSLGTAGSTQGWAGYLAGQLDEVRVYNKALSASDLQALIVLQGKGK
ncbi:hypothetical protein BH11BAC4_BH11BAC4_08540 [soil metagenome]